MTSAAPVAPRFWLRGRLWTALAFVFGLQVALIFWLSDRRPMTPRPTAAAPVYHWSQIKPGELVPLKDPTLFALPHDPALPGTKLAMVPAPEFRIEDWTEPPRWLALSEANLGEKFARFARTNTPPAFANVLIPEPAMMVPDLPPPTPLAVPSRLRLEGGLKQRQLLDQPELPGWPGATLLTNSEVQVLVNGAGNVVFAFLFSRSGSTAADQHALQFARTARFEPISPPGPARSNSRPANSVPGLMVFEWQTLPATNEPPPSPQQ